MESFEDFIKINFNDFLKIIFLNVYKLKVLKLCFTTLNNF